MTDEKAGTTHTASEAPQSSMSETPDSVFSRIALSLSGGGFRASAYSLGTLNGLYLLGLLDNVQMLSTVSAGTLTGAFYALRRKSGQPFEQIYADCYRWHEQDAILPEAIKTWEQASKDPARDFKLIRAFADVYDQHLYDGKRFGEFWEEANQTLPFHLQSIIFGATELYSGLTFRFQHSAFLPASYQPKDEPEPHESYYVGNGNVHIKLKDAKQLRLADIAAASSCFPVGFEPLIMPDDFFPTAPRPKLHGWHERPVPQQIALVDGGVYDNQGIESLRKANQHNQEYCRSSDFAANTLTPAQLALLQPSTLFLLADVDGAPLGMYDAATPALPTSSSPSVGQLVRYARWGLIALGVLTAGVLLASLGAGSFLAGGLVAFLLVGVGLAWSVRKLWKALQTMILENIDERVSTLAVPVLLRLSLGQWKYLLLVRLKSGWVVILSFMRRIRSLNYGLLYEQEASPPNYRVMASIIGALLRDSKNYRPKPGHSSVRDDLKAVEAMVQRASDMDTTLWWHPKDPSQLPTIVACGVMTLCYRLLLHFEKFKPTGPLGQDVQRRAQLIWQAFVSRNGHLMLPPSLLAELRNDTCTLNQLLAKVDAPSGSTTHPH